MQQRAHHATPFIARLALVVLATVTLLGLGPSLPTVQAALQQSDVGDVCADQADILIGQDNDNLDNPLIQPPDTAANQSLNNTDVLVGRGGCDILIGLLGSDVMDGAGGSDILIGGTEQGMTPNSDIMFGRSGNDISIWAPGDGSDAFIGGSGLDAQVFGVIDRDENNVPILSPVEGRHSRTGLPTANVTGQGGFCTLERVPDDAELGFAFLVRFFVRATGNLAVTIRLSADVEQVFCTSEAGGAIIFADLTAANPAFVEVSLDQVQQLNRTVAQIIR
jgi:Ca2+-binding RTX toxin-like protein